MTEISDKNEQMSRPDLGSKMPRKRRSAAGLDGR